MQAWLGVILIVLVALSAFPSSSILSSQSNDMTRYFSGHVQKLLEMKNKDPAKMTSPAKMALSEKMTLSEKFEAPLSTAAHLAKTRYFDNMKETITSHPLTTQGVGWSPQHAYALPTITPESNTVFNLDPTIAPQNEQSVTFCPGPTSATDNVIGCSNDYRELLFGPGFSASGFFVSLDGGSSTFKDGVIPGPVGPDALWPSGDPVLARDNNCNFFYSGLGIDDLFEQNAILVARSGPDLTGTATLTGSEWPTIVAIHQTDVASGTGGFNDKEWMAVDNSGGSFDGSVYVSWTFFNNAAAASQILFARCPNDLSACTVLRSEANPLSGAATATQFSYVTVGPDGMVYVAWWESTVTGIKLKMRTSGPGGTSFGPIRTIAAIADPLDGNFGFGGITYNHFRIITMPKIAVDDMDNVHAVWDQCRLGGNFPIPTFFGVFLECVDANVRYRMSSDAGATWGPIKTIGTATKGTHQFFPTVDFDHTTDNLIIAYYSTQNDKIGGKHQGQRADIYMSASDDGGATFSTVRATTPIMDIGSDFTFYDGFFGDYIHADADMGRVYVHYTGTTQLKTETTTMTAVLQQDNKLQRTSIP